VTLVIKTTIAAILQSSTKQLVVDEIQMPDELFAGQILVKVLSSGICGAQINEIDAIKGPDRFLPHLLGHEGFGTVLDTGPGVTTVAPGDMVVMHWRPGAGIQSAPPIYKWQGQQLSAGWVTTLNNHAVVSENRVTRLSTRIDDKNVIPLLGCALTTALGVLENDARVGFRDSLLIFGGGGVGLLLIKLARFMGVRDITVVDTKIEKLKKAMEIGASNGILFVDKPDSLFQLKKLFGSEFPTVAIDTTGNTDAIEICYEISSAKARVILVGVPKKGMTASFYTLPLHFGKSIKGSEGGGSNPDIDIPILLKLISEGHLSFDDYPTHSFPLSEVNIAISQIRNGVIGRMIINFE
jgi:Zn-dependent alcohol dehydrogenase